MRLMNILNLEFADCLVIMNFIGHGNQFEIMQEGSKAQMVAIGSRQVLANGQL